jgi:hypothetical protein
MKIISHRGNINGPNHNSENRPSYIDSAIKLGYDVEVDIRFIDGYFWLGHDSPQYKIELPWMKMRKNKLWFHCKDQISSLKMLELNDEYQFFCHKNDSFVLTSNSYIWVHDLNSVIDERCIIPLITLNDINEYKNTKPGYVCTDFVRKINIE